MDTLDIILPDTAIAATANKSDLFIYAQRYYGRLVESRTGDGNGKFETTTIDLTTWESVKLFTPLAATTFHDGKFETRYLFYLDKRNVINNLISEHGKWKMGDLGSLNLVTAHYSKLAALTIKSEPEKEGGTEEEPPHKKTPPAECIHVFYQIGDKSGDIREISGHDGNWKETAHHLSDSPLFGTSLAVVKPHPGVIIKSPDYVKTPVVFFQKANEILAELQSTDFRELGFFVPKPSPHTPLAAIDEGSNVYLFYTDDDNGIQRLTINPKTMEEKVFFPRYIDRTEPKGNVAVVACAGKIIVFYQPRFANTIIERDSDAEAPNFNTFATASFNFIGSGETRDLSDPEIGIVKLQLK